MVDGIEVLMASCAARLIRIRLSRSVYTLSAHMFKLTYFQKYVWPGIADSVSSVNVLMPVVGAMTTIKKYVESVTSNGETTLEGLLLKV